MTAAFARSGRRRQQLLVALAAFAACGVVVLAALHAFRRHHAASTLRVRLGPVHGLVALPGGGVAAAAFSSGEVVGVDDDGTVRYHVRIGGHPTNPALLGGEVWVPVIGEGSVAEIDASSGRLVRRVAGTYAGATAGGGGVYLATWSDAPRHPKLWRGRTVTRVDAATGAVRWRRSLGGIVLPLAFRRGRVWVPDFAGNRLTLVSARNGSTYATRTLPGRPVAVAVASSCGWLALAGGTLLRVDSRTLRTLGSTPLAGGNVDYLAVGDDGVWVTSYTSASSAVLEHVSCATGRVDVTRRVGGASQGLAVTSGAVWLADFGAGQVIRLRRHDLQKANP